MEDHEVWAYTPRAYQSIWVEVPYYWQRWDRCPVILLPSQMDISSISKDPLSVHSMGKRVRCVYMVCSRSYKGSIIITIVAHNQLYSYCGQYPPSWVCPRSEAQGSSSLWENVRGWIPITKVGYIDRMWTPVWYTELNWLGVPVFIGERLWRRCHGKLGNMNLTLQSTTATTNVTIRA